jgi:hypothetical protein
MREYDVGEQTVHDLIKNKSRLITFAGVSDSAGGMTKQKSMKSSTYDELDQAMALWFSQQRAQEIPVPGAIFAVQGEKFSCDEPAADKFKNEFQKFTENEGFILEQIFNADETGLYWKSLLKKTLAYETETSAAGHKAQKQHFTVLCYGNNARTFFMKPCVIRTVKKPCTFSGIEISNLPVHYYHNKSVWINRNLM